LDGKVALLNYAMYSITTRNISIPLRCLACLVIERHDLITESIWNQNKSEQGRMQLCLDFVLKIDQYFSSSFS